MARPLTRRAPSLGNQRHPIVAIGASGSVTKVNGAARKLLGDEGIVLEGANLGAIIAGFFAQRHLAGGVASLALPAAPDRDATLTIVLSEDRPDGGLPLPEVTPIGDGRDITLDATERRLSDYIAHELKNPIGAIRALARILRLRYDAVSDEDRSAAINSIETDAERALLILEALLALAQRRRTPVSTESVIPLHAVLRKVVSAHRRRNPDRAMELIGDSPIYACADSMSVELALGNLLNNAEKYSPRNSSIQVSSHQEGSRVTILVMNEGVSLPAERYPRLWNIYTTAGETDIVVSGSGIGLALCKDLVEGMGGRVWAGPRRSGGSIFAITLATSEAKAWPRSLSPVPEGAAPRSFAEARWNFVA